MQDTFNAVADIIAETCNIDRTKILPTSHTINDLGIDSLDFLDVTFAIDKRFSIKMPIEKWMQDVNEGKAIRRRLFHHEQPLRPDRRVERGQAGLTRLGRRFQPGRPGDMRLEYFQLVDRVEAIDPVAGTITARAQVPQQSTIFEGHFPGYPILPGVLLVECMAQTAGHLILVLEKFQRMPFLAQIETRQAAPVRRAGASLADRQRRLVHLGSGYAVTKAERANRSRPRWPRRKSASAPCHFPAPPCAS